VDWPEAKSARDLWRQGRSLECGGKRSATPLFVAQLRGVAHRLILDALESHTPVKKAPSPLRFAGAVQNELFVSFC
jgi:hypothetical protein